MGGASKLMRPNRLDDQHEPAKKRGRPAKKAPKLEIGVGDSETQGAGVQKGIRSAKQTNKAGVNGEDTEVKGTKPASDEREPPKKRERSAKEITITGHNRENSDANGVEPTNVQKELPKRGRPAGGDAKPDAGEAPVNDIKMQSVLTIKPRAPAPRQSPPSRAPLTLQFCNSCTSTTSRLLEYMEVNDKRKFVFFGWKVIFHWSEVICI